MSEVIKKPVKITETILRDAHQSLIATRMTTEQMLPIIDKMDKVGYHAVECWGGATFDASLRFLKEDPWDRLRKIRDGFKNTKLQMLFRGQNILGYRPYADDVVEYFVQKSIANGIDIIRIFDCLNDVRNLQVGSIFAKLGKNFPPNSVKIPKTLVCFRSKKYFFSKRYTTYITDSQLDKINTNLCDTTLCDTNLCDSKKSCTFAANFQTQVL